MKGISKIQYITQSKTEESILLEVKDVLESGVGWVQLRIKDDTLDFLEIAKKVKKLTDSFKATLIITDNVHVAKQIDADGVHVDLTDTSIQDAKALLGDDKIIGGSANTFADAKNVELFDADYITLGPFKHNSSKEDLIPALGLKTYEEIIPKTEPYGWKLLMFNIPIIAIGGLEIEDVKSLKASTGIYGVAVSELINNSQNKNTLFKELKDILD